MTQQDEARVSSLMCDVVGGRSPWVVLWSDDDHPNGSIISSVQPEDVPELICIYLLAMLRREMGVPAFIAREH